MEIKTDVLVIGAGPSGAMAARTLAQNKVDILLIDKKSEIGTPKRCAEGILTSTLEELNIKPDKRWITREVTGIEIQAPNKKTITFDENTIKLPDTGYILERKVFDKHLVMDAIRYGARVMIKTWAYSIERIDDGFTVSAIKLGQEIKIRTKIIIAADGPDSRIGKMAGLKCRTELNNMASCIQYEMANVKLNENLVKIHIGSVCPGGYIWIFPKGEDIANIGLGILKSHADQTAKYYLDNFIKDAPEISGGQIIEMNVGGDPLGGLVEDRYDDNIMLVGDAAGFVDPLTGDGIKTAMLSGKYAGIVASKAIKESDCSKKILKEYYDLTEENIGKDFSKYNKVKEFLLTLDDNSLNRIVEEISKTKLDEVTVTKLLKIIVKASPKSILKLGKLL